MKCYEKDMIKLLLKTICMLKKQIILKKCTCIYEWVQWQIVQLHTQQIWGALAHAASPFGEAIDHSWVMCLEIEVLHLGISL